MSSYGNYGYNHPVFDSRRLSVPVKPRVFVSYHHRLDQGYYDRFSQIFASGFNIFTDTSIDRKIDSDDSGYQQRVIREEHVTGSSITIVLCGAETWKRRWVDWEIHMTLNKEHALLGIVLPTATTNQFGEIIVPDRLLANVNTGYASWIHWTEDSSTLRAAIDLAKEKALVTRNIDNSASRMVRSRP